MFTEYQAHEMLTISERTFPNTLKFGTSGEVNSQEGINLLQRIHPSPPNCSEVVTPQVELNGAVGEALIRQLVP